MAEFNKLEIVETESIVDRLFERSRSKCSFLR